MSRCSVCGCVGCGERVETDQGVATRCPRMDRVALAFVVGREFLTPDELEQRLRAITSAQARALAWLAGQDRATVSALLSILGLPDGLGDIGDA